MFPLRRFGRELSQLFHSIRRGEPYVPYDELRRREQLYRLLAENNHDIIWLLDLPDEIRYVSPACQEILGWSPAEQLNRPGGVAMLTEASSDRVRKLFEDAILAGRETLVYEAEHRHADGHAVWCEVRHRFLYDEAGKPVSTIGVTRDISAKRRLEEQLAESQKREAIGVLAGGVAHDFNNYLTVIIGALEMLGDDIPKTDTKAALLADALDASERSAALTGQLLALSRHQPTAIDSLDVNAILRRSDELVRRIATERIRVEVVLARGLSFARGDENQVHQILVNLVMNARDAISGTGTITLETANVLIDRDYAESRSGLAAGRYVMIGVSDDGRGMNAEELAQATEPFFSTKERGRGTGLGLAMVKSIVERSGGDLSIYSEPGVGTTVKIYLPAIKGKASFDPPRPLESVDLRDAFRGAERVLIVEDEQAVRAVVRQILELAGYVTHEASTPGEALEKLDRLGETGEVPDLVLTDLVMPEMYGTQLASRISESHPGMRFVVMSGYAENGASKLTREAMPGPLVNKPFHANELLRAVRLALDAPAAQTASRS